MYWTFANVCKSIRCVIITDIDAGKYKCVYETRSRIVLMIRIKKKVQEIKNQFMNRNS